MSGTIGAGKIEHLTGASSYIASWLVKLLLQRGYTIKASVGDPSPFSIPLVSVLIRVDFVLPK
ncbi:hypothetical protein ACJRO7_012890 [Eucalyptus globulus]|uniref:Uncharacterized protein n=1 Tax=Eucalyptus globulus TaxID=34317 RepID=A0ABD3LK52_EUCGL